MHLIVPFAALDAPACQQALAGLKLPLLQQLLAQLSPLAPDLGSNTSYSMPHQRALAKALKLPVVDGQIPLAALQARQAGLADKANAGWAFLSLCHWQVNSGQAIMAALPVPALSPVQSNQLLELMQPFFATEGINLYPDTTGCWLAQGAPLSDLICAAPQRVLGRHVLNWLPQGRQQGLLLRLQNEMQMLLHTCPINQERAALNLPSVNSFWLHGSGQLPSHYQTPSSNQKPKMANHLTQAALALDWSAWARGWQELEQQEIKALLAKVAASQPVCLTLCGERASRSWHWQPLSLWQKVKRRMHHKPLAHWLEQL